MAIDLTPARVSACAPRSSVSRAARAASTLGDHNSTIAGPATSGAGNGSYIQVVDGADAGADADGGMLVAVDRGLRGSVSMPRPSTIRTRAFRGTSVNTCVSPEGQLTVSVARRTLAPRPITSSFECCE